MPTTRSSSSDSVRWCGAASLNTMVMMAFLSLARRALCSASTPSSFMFEITSPFTSTKSSLISCRASISRSASPADTQSGPTTTWIVRFGTSFQIDALMNAWICSACAVQNTKISITPADERNSIAYESAGTLTSGSKHCRVDSVAPSQKSAGSAHVTSVCVCVCVYARVCPSLHAVVPATPAESARRTSPPSRRPAAECCVSPPTHCPFSTIDRSM
jgi:hypothetical protein